VLPRIERPKKLEGATYQIRTGCGNLYVTIGSIEGNGAEPIEVIARMGKAGGCANSLNEAVGRAISIGLQWGVPIKEYMDTLKGLQCPNPFPFPHEERCLSCPDGVSISIGRHLDGYEELVNNTSRSVEKPSAGQCPGCSSLLVFQEGCSICPSCGYSKC